MNRILNAFRFVTGFARYAVAGIRPLWPWLVLNLGLNLVLGIVTGTLVYLGVVGVTYLVTEYRRELARKSEGK